MNWKKATIIKGLASVGMLVGYGELRAISLTSAAIGLGVIICTVIYCNNSARRDRDRDRERDRRVERRRDE